MESTKVFSDQLTQETIEKAFDKIQCDPEHAVQGCHYEIACSEARQQEVLDFIRDQFIPDEPLARSIAKIYPWTEETAGLWMSLVKQNLSLVLVSDTSGEIVAVRVTAVNKKGKNIDLNTINSEGLRKILGILGALDSQCDLYDHYNAEEAISFIALGVHTDYRRRGIGLKVQQAAVAMVAKFELGPILVKGEGTSNFSKKIYEKLGFDILAEVLYDDYKEDGEIVFKNMGNDKSVKRYGKLVG